MKIPAIFTLMVALTACEASPPIGRASIEVTPVKSPSESSAHLFLSELENVARTKQHSPDTALLGIALNAKRPFPSCSVASSASSCLEAHVPEKGMRKYYNPSYQVHLAPGEWPDFMSDDKYLTIETDKSSRVQKIEASINSRDFDKVLELLTAKYGKPNFMVPPGHRYWSYANMHVELLNYPQNMSRIEIRTDALELQHAAYAKIRLADEAAKAVAESAKHPKARAL